MRVYAKKKGQVRETGARTAGGGDFARKVAGKAKRRRRVLDPAANSRFGGDVIKGGIDFDGGKIIRVELEPARGREFGRIKITEPFLETPRAGADSDFLLCGEIQRALGRIIPSRGLQSPLRPAGS